VSEDKGLYDRYLDTCLSGELTVPELFLAAHPNAEDTVREKIRELYVTLRGSDEEILPFLRLGNFRLLQRLEGGGVDMFVAVQDPDNRVVALKIVRADPDRDVASEQRFEHDAEAIVQLRHEHVVRVYEAGVCEGVRYVAMELVPGRMLGDIVSRVAAGREALGVEHLVRWIAQTARALEYAHQKGLLHRDVKPSNIRIATDDNALLLDFGIAYGSSGNAATTTRSLQGAPTYAAPEQIRGKPADARTDVYGLGATLYRCLTGVVPFAADTVDGVFAKALTEQPVPPRRLRHAVSRDLETVVLKAMEKERRNRYRSAAAFADDLEAILELRPPRVRPPGPLRRFWRRIRRRT